MKKCKTCRFSSDKCKDIRNKNYNRYIDSIKECKPIKQCYGIELLRIKCAPKDGYKCLECRREWSKHPLWETSRIDKENSIHCILKKEFFEKIKSGIKTHEYREYKDFWIQRLGEVNSFGMVDKKLEKRYVRFSLGMSSEHNKNMIFKIDDITVIDGKNTDLKHDGLVYDIKLGDRLI